MGLLLQTHRKTNTSNDAGPLFFLCFVLVAVFGLHTSQTSIHPENMRTRPTEETYVDITERAAVPRRAFTYKHVEAIQTGAAIPTRVGVTFIKLQFTPKEKRK